MKSSIIIFLLFITTLVGCGNPSNDQGEDNGGNNPSSEINDQGDREDQGDDQNQADDQDRNEDENEEEDEEEDDDD